MRTLYNTSISRYVSICRLWCGCVLFKTIRHCVYI